MPIVVNGYIFSLAPKRAPFLMRPLVSIVLSGLSSQLVEPRMKDNFEMVCSMSSMPVSTPMTDNVSQIEAHLAKQPSGWFAGGEGPTSADFMMGFALEGVAAHLPKTLGPKTKEYVDRVHAR